MAMSWPRAWCAADGPRTLAYELRHRKKIGGVGRNYIKRLIRGRSCPEARAKRIAADCCCQWPGTVLFYAWDWMQERVNAPREVQTGRQEPL